MRTTSMWWAVLGLLVLASACSTTVQPSPGSVDPGEPGADRSASCASLFATILERERADDTSGAIDAELDLLGDRCPGKYQVFVDYLSMKTSASMGAGGRCSEYAAYDLRPAAIALASTDGYCTGPRRRVRREPFRAPWTCHYAPTYNDDWHDDVVCTNGIDQQRPYLRSWDSFVTEGEIMESAREYERELNGG